MRDIPPMTLISLKVPEIWKLRVTLVARMCGFSRSAYIRQAVLDAIERDLARVGPGQRRETGNDKSATKRGRRGNPR